MGWTDERVELLKQLWTEGLSASQIAERLGGVSRNAVIGKVHRLKLESRTKPAAEEKTEEPVVEAVAAEPEGMEEPAPEPAFEYVETSEPVAAPAAFVAAATTASMARSMPRSVGATALKFQPEEEFVAEEALTFEERPSGEVVPIARKLSLVQLTDRTCKWPVGDPLHADFHFCGNASKDSSPYCEFHCKMAFQAVERRRIR